MRRLIVISVLACMALIATQSGVAAPGGNAANAKKCQKGGYTSYVRSDGTSFASQDECTSYAAGGGTLTLKSAGQLACEQVGGVYGSASGTTVFTCNQYATTLEEYNDEEATLRSVCYQSGGNMTEALFNPNTNPVTTTFTCSAI
jgi:hypothetical protein